MKKPALAPSREQSLRRLPPQLLRQRHNRRVGGRLELALEHGLIRPGALEGLCPITRRRQRGHRGGP